MAVLNAVAVIAEREGHHPDHSLTKYRDLVLTMTTHASKGLTMNDFVMAKLINQACETVQAP
jgi:4a-hydroxytetrahydrobiopterin dehydratase